MDSIHAVVFWHLNRLGVQRTEFRMQLVWIEMPIYCALHWMSGWLAISLEKRTIRHVCLECIGQWVKRWRRQRHLVCSPIWGASSFIHCDVCLCFDKFKITRITHSCRLYSNTTRAKCCFFWNENITSNNLTSAAHTNKHMKMKTESEKKFHSNSLFLR